MKALIERFIETLASRKFLVTLLAMTMLYKLASSGNLTDVVGMWICTAAGAYIGGNVVQKLKEKKKDV